VTDRIIDAPCKEDPEAWFPVSMKPALTEGPKAICNLACPFKAACLEIAITGRYTFGIWAGLTPDERQHLYPQSHPVRDRPDMDEAVRKAWNLNIEDTAKKLGIPQEAVRASRRRLAARKTVAA
jgi:transcription factor WhiB